jgi:hypothetical protein
VLFQAIGPALSAVAVLAYAFWAIAKAVRKYRNDPKAYKQEVEDRRKSRKAAVSTLGTIVGADDPTYYGDDVRKP